MNVVRLPFITFAMYSSQGMLRSFVWFCDYLIRSKGSETSTLSFSNNNNIKKKEKIPM